jgi:hypothetical protein
MQPPSLTRLRDHVAVVVVGYWQTVSLLLVPPATALIILYTVNFGPLAWPITLLSLLHPFTTSTSPATIAEWKPLTTDSLKSECALLGTI